MNRIWAILGLGFLGLNLSGCGGSGDMMAPDNLGTPTAAQSEREKAYAEETAQAEKEQKLKQPE